jgi:nitroreductase
MIAQILFTIIVLPNAWAQFHYDDKYDYSIEVGRRPEHFIHPLLATRSSQREFTGDDISDTDLMSIFEASRWTPSGHDIQPWRFVYAKRNTPRFNEFAGVLNSTNQAWANKSSVLMIMVVPNYEVYNGKILPTDWNMFDGGSSYMAMALEASGRGYSAIGLGGLDYDAAYELIGINRRTHTIPILIALGKNPDDQHRKTPKTIPGRRDIKEFVYHERFVSTDPEGDAMVMVKNIKSNVTNCAY